MVLDCGQFGQKFTRLQLSHVVGPVAPRVQMGHIGQRLRVEIVVVVRIGRFGRSKPPIFANSVIALVVAIPAHANQPFDKPDALRARLDTELRRSN